MAKELPVIQPGQRPAGQTPIFERIGIVGLGLIGGSIALRARELWPSSLVIAVDQKDVLEVVRYLTSKGINPAIVSAKGRGDQHPVAANDTKPGRGQNRRIELVVEQPAG